MDLLARAGAQWIEVDEPNTKPAPQIVDGGTPKDVLEFMRKSVVRGSKSGL